MVIVTTPAALDTVIDPTTGGPAVGKDGSNIIRLLPNSSTDIAKSVPLTDTDAVGVFTFISSLLFLAIRPEAYLTVPKVAFIASLPLPEEGSYTNSSIVSLLNSVHITLVPSSKVIPALPFKVSSVSFISTPVSTLPSILLLFLVICVGPVTSVSLPA